MRGIISNLRGSVCFSGNLMAEVQKNEDTGTDAPVWLFQLCLSFACGASTTRVIITKNSNSDQNRIQSANKIARAMRDAKKNPGQNMRALCRLTLTIEEASILCGYRRQQTNLLFSVL